MQMSPDILERHKAMNRKAEELVRMCRSEEDFKEAIRAVTWWVGCRSRKLMERLEEQRG
jgi:hypothetical protein